MTFQSIFIALIQSPLLTFSISISNLQPAFPTESARLSFLSIGEPGDLTFSLVERGSITGK